MLNLPSIEFLEKTHTFPGKYLFKIIGSAERDFADRVADAVALVLPNPTDAMFTQRTSGTGRHLAVTIEVQVTSAQTVHELYKQFATLEGIVMLL